MDIITDPNCTRDMDTDTDLGSNSGPVSPWLQWGQYRPLIMALVAARPWDTDMIP